MRYLWLLLGFILFLMSTFSLEIRIQAISKAHDGCYAGSQLNVKE